MEAEELNYAASSEQHGTIGMYGGVEMQRAAD